jgi:hypothetical protein
MTGRDRAQRRHDRRGGRRTAAAACAVLAAGAALIAAGPARSGEAGGDETGASAHIAEADRETAGNEAGRDRFARVTDRVRLGDSSSEHRHRLDARGPTARTTGTAEQGQLSERYEARSVAASGRFGVRLDVRRSAPLTLQLRELRPNDAWGAAYGFRVYLDGRLTYVRDNATADAGGGVYRSFFVDTRDRAITDDGQVEVVVEGTSAERAYFTDIWAYADLAGMVEDQGMRVADRLVFVLGQDYRPEADFRARLDYIRANLQATDEVKLGFAVLDYFPVRTREQMAANYRRWLALSREYGLPFAIESTSDWEGTPRGVSDGEGGFFGDLQYQQFLWSPQDQTGPDRDTYRNPDGEVQRLDAFLGAGYEPRYGLSVPNVWGSTPWLTWHHPDLNAFYARKAGDSTEEIRPLVWDLQRSGELGRLLPFSSTAESVYWSKRDNVGVWDIVYTGYNGGVERRDIFADLNPHTVAAARADGVTLDPTDGWSEAEKRWLYRNQSHHQQFFTDLFYYGLPRERIAVDGSRTRYPQDMLRHNVHSEIYSRKQEPYYTATHPSTAQAVVKRGRPGAQYISLADYTPGGFHHLQRLREFGRIANPNLENAVSTHAPDKTLLLREAYVNGSRYTTPYNWRTAAPDEAKDWIAPYLADMTPWDTVNDAPPDGRVSGETTVSQAFTAGEVRLLNRVDVRIERTGRAEPLRLTVREAGGRVVTMRHLGESEIAPRDGWLSFELPIESLERGREYVFELEQVEGGRAAYAYPTAGGDLLYRAGLDMAFERDRSLLIQWRRDAADAIANVAEQLANGDDDADETLDRARLALAADRYVEAYRLAIRADSLRFPVLYQARGEAELDPFGLELRSAGTLDVDVAAHERGPRGGLTLALRAYKAGSVELALRHPPRPARVTVDGVEQPARYVRGELRFTVELADSARHTVEVASR